jgi:hypothetical protein
VTDRDGSGDRGSWAIGGMTLVGLGVGLIFIKASALLFVASLLSGIGVGLLIASVIPRKRG